MGSIKDRNGMDVTEDIKRRWQEYTEELHKKDLHDPDNHDGVITHLEPDIQECEVKWALGKIIAMAQSSGHIKLAVTNSYCILDSRSKATTETNFQFLPLWGIHRETFRTLL